MPLGPMNQAADLDAALRFVTRRVNEQGDLSGEPLDAQQSLLLANLPSWRPAMWIPGPEIPYPELVPRDVNYERLCALAKAAYLRDQRIHPESRDWKFAFGVFALARHPMWGLLNSAAVLTDRRSLWDQLLVIIAGLIPVIGVVLLLWLGFRSPFSWIGMLCGTVAVMLGIYFVSRKIEHWRLENHIERYRLAARNVG
jgi:hypothetical protein